MSSKASAASDLTLDPNQVFRPRDAQRYFGLKHTQIAEKVKRGEIRRRSVYRQAALPSVGSVVS